MTKLSKYFNMVNEGDTHTTYTYDSWTIPDKGAEIWCTGWSHGQTIKPYGDGCHVIVGTSMYHCDELMGILTNWERDGRTWGIDGVTAKREQQTGGYWKAIG